MKELTLVGVDGVKMAKCLVEVKGVDLCLEFKPPLYGPIVAITLTEEKKEDKHGLPGMDQG